MERPLAKKYKYGFITDIPSDTIPPGLNTDVIQKISEKKKEPSWMLDLRLKAYRHWQTMTEPQWADLQYPPIDYQSIQYFSAPVQKKKKIKSLDEVDPELLKTFEKLGIPLQEQKRLSGVAVDACF